MAIGRLFNLARMTTATTGTGTLTLGSAVSGYLSFSGAGVSNGDVVSYGIIDGSNSEVGTGTYTSSGTTLSRTVIASTNSGSAISLSGSAEVFITALANNILPAQTTAVQMILNSMANARAAGVAHYGGMSFADSFGATTYVDTAGATALDTGTAGLLKPTNAGGAISGGTGTNIGDLTGNGGLAAAFDGNTNQSYSASAYKYPVGVSSGAFAGKTYSSAKQFTRAVVTPANGTSSSYWSNSYTTETHTIRIRGKTGSAPSSHSDGTSLGTAAVTNNATTPADITITDTNTYEHVWAVIETSGSFAGSALFLAEIVFYEAGSTNNLTVASNSIALASVPATIIPVIRIKHVDTATAGTDYNLYVSRDGGTTYSSAASLTDWGVDPFETNVHIVYGAPVDVSGQPSGSNLRLKIITSNNKSLEVRDWGAAAYQ